MIPNERLTSQVCAVCHVSCGRVPVRPWRRGAGRHAATLAPSRPPPPVSKRTSPNYSNNPIWKSFSGLASTHSHRTTRPVVPSAARTPPCHHTPRGLGSVPMMVAVSASNRAPALTARHDTGGEGRADRDVGASAQVTACRLAGARRPRVQPPPTWRPPRCPACRLPPALRHSARAGQRSRCVRCCAPTRWPCGSHRHCPTAATCAERPATPCHTPGPSAPCTGRSARAPLAPSAGARHMYTALEVVPCLLGSASHGRATAHWPTCGVGVGVGRWGCRACPNLASLDGHYLHQTLAPRRAAPLPAAACVHARGCRRVSVSVSVWLCV